MLDTMFRAVLLLVLVHCDAATSNNATLLKQLYETNLNYSVTLDREDRVLMSSWLVASQVKRVNVTTKYRVQMTRHKEHSFKRTDSNTQWTECVFIHRRQIRKSEKSYYADESECLTTITGDDRGKTRAVEQVENESRKWRKGYRYLVNTCNADNPNDDEAATLCLVRYMEKDSYNEVIQRLIMLKLESMGKLFLHLNDSLKDLEECLKTQLSVYLVKIRTVMESVNKCYNLVAKESEVEEKVNK